MRNHHEREKGNDGGTGDGPSASQAKAKSSSTENDDFLFGYGNYGDPHSFAPYQLILLLIDFIFNWTMDLTHEYPLAILVIFVFQSLAIIINLILYIMASANQAMQAGLHKRVTIHHWLNLGICVLYMSLTGWWFIWALRKSWPSVSDQFSFTWPAAGLQPVINSTYPGTANGSLSSGNVTRRYDATKNGTGNHDEIIKEHYTMWSNGFIALYVPHRTVAILYYFIYLRATFLVLNTPEIDRFVEKKKNLVERFWEAKNAEKESGGKSSRKKRGILTNSYAGEEGLPHPPFSLGLREYLAESSKFLMESEAVRQGKSDGDSVVKSKSKRQILWADDNTAKGSSKRPDDQGNDKDDDIEPKPGKGHRPKSSKSRRRPSEEVEDAEEESTNVTRYHHAQLSDEIDDDNDGDEPEKYRKEKARHRERTKPRRGQRRSSREEVEEDDNE